MAAENAFPDGVPRIRIGIWSDTPFPADQLTLQLRDNGQQAVILGAGRTTPIECLVVLMKRRLGAADLVQFAELANQSRMTIVIEQGINRLEDHRWPREATLSWSGQIPDLARVAHALVSLIRPGGLMFATYPALLLTDGPLLQAPVAATREALIDQIRRPDEPRVILIEKRLFEELLAADEARSPQDYDLIRFVRWASDEQRRAIINMRLGRPEELNISLTRPESLGYFINDRRTRRLVMVLGEPGSGKSLQLRYYDACAALQSLRHREESNATMNSFYVALSEQSATPDISFDWLASQWKTVVDTDRWCDLDQFVRDGGMVLLDGLNEGGVRTLPLNQWMLHWRDVIRDLLKRGAAKVVVSCRTRDQVIPMRAPRDEPPTAVAILPLALDDIIAIATEDDTEMGVRLGVALREDPHLVELYSNPFRLMAFLRSGAAQVATTEAHLFGTAISAAIVHEWEQDNDHGPLIPGSHAVQLKHLEGSRADPWPLLESMPLIRGLGGFAKQLTRPSQPGGRARPTMSPRDAEIALSRAVAEAGGPPVDPQLIVKTARDLHVLEVEPTKVRFAHPSMQHLFAALGSTVEEMLELVEQERGHVTTPDSAIGDNHALPRVPITAPGYAHHRYDELFQFAAQLRGVEVPERLLHADPVLAARTFLSIRTDTDTDPAAADPIKAALLDALGAVTEPMARSAILAALGDLGWSLPSAHEGGGGTTTLVPAYQWQLGDRGDQEVRADRGVGSEVRTISLPQFRISRYPVSNGEFESFVQNGGYEDQSLWSSEGWEWRSRRRTVEQFISGWKRRQLKLLSDFPGKVVELLRTNAASPVGAAALYRFATMPEWEIAEYARTLQALPVTAPRYWQETILRNRVQPVVGVSWFEANAFCAWLGRRLGVGVRLPSENEWEAACLYSWGVTSTADIESVLGSDFGNTYEFNYPATTPIGAFATGLQEQQLLPVELLGNIYEWIFDYYAPGIHTRRIVKGGSWRQEHWRAHPAYRGRGDVDAQNDDMGFRYVITEGPM